MIANKLWEFPVPSSSMHSGNVKMVYPGDVLLLFDYFDEAKGAVFNSGIFFNGVQALRHTCDEFIMSGAVNADLVSQAHGWIVEYPDSGWVEYFRKLDRKIADYWGIRHFGIYLDSIGFYEFLATSFQILDTQEGSMDGYSIPQ